MLQNSIFIDIFDARVKLSVGKIIFIFV